MHLDEVEWLDAISALVGERSVHVEVSRPDDDTLAITAGSRGVVLHTVGADGFLMPSVASGRTIASRLQERVKHFDPQRFAIEPATVAAVVTAALDHLHEAR